MRRRICVLFTALLAFGCASTGLKVSQEFVSGVDVSAWRGYAWSGPLSTVKDPQLREAHKRIRTAVDAELAGKGYALVDRERADFLVSNSIYANLDIPELSKREERAVREQEIATGQLERSLPPGVGYGGHASGDGALYLFFSRPDGKAVWQGTVETVLNYRGAGIKKVPSAIRKVLKDFPARSGTG